MRAILAKHGCVKVHQVGSHQKWRTPGGLSDPGVAGKLATKARAARGKAEEATAAAQTAVAEAVQALAEQGLPSTAIGPLVGVSPQRVQQLLAHRRHAVSGTP